MQLITQIFAAYGLASLVATFGVVALVWRAAKEPLIPGEDTDPCPTQPIGHPTDGSDTTARSDPGCRPMKLVGNCACASCRPWPGDDR